jgi:regulatory protein
MGETVKKDQQKVSDRMKALCSRREYCLSDIRKKVMTLLDGDESGTQAVLDQLVEQKYVDDLRYASAFARDKSSIAGWGEVKIRYMLAAKGISRDIISEALAEIDEQKACGRLEKLISNKARSLNGDPQIRMKLLRFGLGRGYSYDEVSSVVEQLLRNQVR